MSEELKRQYTLTEYVFRDLRFGNTYPNFATKCDKYELMNKLVRIKDPVESVKAYSDTIKGNKSLYPFDVERWELALKTYKLYPCINESDNYTINNKDCTINYNCNRTTIRITADVLTGPREIIECAEQLYKIAAQQRKYSILKSALNDFCSVAYTVGNVCPVMMNPGGRKGEPGGVDTCWYKLANHIKKNIEYDSIKEIPQHFNNVSRIYNNLNVRHLLSYNPKQKKRTEPPYYYALFGVFPERLSGKKIINNLMLKDYYDDNYNLIINKTPKEYYDLGVDEYIKFIRLVTTLIIKRGIRIYNALPDNMKKTE